MQIPSDHNLLAALQLGDSFFPSGLYTQSHGLERFIEGGQVRDAATLEPLLQSYLLDQIGPCEGVAVRWVVCAAATDDLEQVAAIDARLHALKLAPEVRAAATRCGRQILNLGATISGCDRVQRYRELVSAGQAPGNQSIASALLAHAAGLDAEAAVTVELHSFAVSLISAAVRLGACDHMNAQAMLWRVRPVLAAACALGRERHWQAMGSFAPLIDLMQAQHSYAESHMFVS
ncbi:MAG: urease accessory protein UreF [Oscillochloridaceae bacterium umkhey_bin13]